MSITSSASSTLSLLAIPRTLTACYGACVLCMGALLPSVLRHARKERTPLCTLGALPAAVFNGHHARVISFTLSLSCARAYVGHLWQDLVYK